MNLDEKKLALFARLAAQRGLTGQGQENPAAENGKGADGDASGTTTARAAHSCPSGTKPPLLFPMTDIQRAYWLGRSRGVGLGGVGSHGYQEFDCGFLDLERLARCWDRVVARHDMLRAVVSDNGMFSVFESVPPTPWRVVDLRPHSPDEREAMLLEIRETRSRRVPDLSVWPVVLLDATIVSDDFIRLHLSCDATVADIYSMGIAMRELSFFYLNPGAELPPPGMTFGEYALELKAGEKTPHYDQCRRYWRERLDSLPLAPRLPVLDASPASPRFRRLTSRLEPDEWAAFRNACRKCGLTGSTALFAVFCSVLGMWSSTGQFCVNVTLLARDSERPQIRDVVGDFATTLLASARACAPGESFADYAGSLAGDFWEALDHSAYSGIRVLQDLSESLGRVTLMPVVFTSTLGAGDLGRIFDASKAVFDRFAYSSVQTPQVWIDHQVLEDNGRLVFNWDVVEGVFPPAVLDSMFSAYKERMHALAASPGAWEADASPKLPAEQAGRRPRGHVVRSPGHLLHEDFFAHAFARPEAMAVLQEETHISYGELAGAALAVSRTLRDLLPGEKRDQLVAVGLSRGWKQVAAVLGVLAAGAAYVPVDPSWPAARRAAVLSQGISAVVADDGAAAGDWGGLPLVRVEPPASPGEPASRQVPRLPRCDTDPDSPAYVIFTSGTTGTPKGVVMSHAGAWNTIRTINERFAVGPGDRVLALSDLSFDLSVYDIFGMLSAGGSLLVPAPEEARDPLAWRRLMERHRPTLWNSVPALWQMLLDSGSPPSCMPRLVLLSGDWMPVDLPARTGKIAPCARLVSLGGATEAGIWSTAHETTPVDPPPGWTSIPYGRALDGQTMDVLHEDLSPCPDDVIGQIHIGGASLALGYLGDEALTRERFVTHPVTGERLYRTGDLGRWRSNGLMEFMGREDAQVKINGMRIELGDVEAALRTLPGVARAVAGVRILKNGTRRLVAHVQPATPDESPDPEALRSGLKELLPTHMVPREIHLVDAFPLSRNGKVDRAALPLPDETPEEPIDRGSALEERLREIVAVHAGSSGFGLDDKFFDIGITSASLVAVQRDVNMAFGTSLALVRFFEAPSVRSLARLMGGGTNAPDPGTDRNAAVPAGEGPAGDRARRAARRKKNAARETPFAAS